MKISLANAINSIKDIRGIDNDMLREVLGNIEVDDDITIDEIIEHLEPSDLDYSGACHEQIDSMIDIYNYDLRKWAVDNWEWCEQAVENGLTDGTDYHKMIQCGQYEYYNDQFYSALDDLTSELENI